MGLYRAGVATISSGSSSADVDFTSAFPPGSAVIVAIAVRDRASGRFSNDDCFPAVRDVSPTGFTLQWRDLSGSSCNVQNGSVSANYIAVAAQ